MQYVQRGRTYSIFLDFGVLTENVFSGILNQGEPTMASLREIPSGFSLLVSMCHHFSGTKVLGVELFR